MHIVFLSNEYPLWAPGGIGSFLQTFGRSLVQNGHFVTVLGVGKKDTCEYLEDEGIEILRLPENKTKLPDFMVASFRLNRELRRIHKENPVDILESPEGGMAFISKNHRAKKVIRLHGGHHFFAEAEKRGINWRKGILEKRSFQKADGFIAVSQYVKNHTEKYLSYHKQPLEVIHHPLDTATQIPEVAIEENHILFAGTVCEKKGIRQLIEAFKILREKYPSKILDIYGRDWFYPNGDSYIEMLKNTYDASYFGNVVFHSTIPRDQLNVRYAEAAFCVFPSHMETQGLVTLEAMLMRKPVIFSKYGPGPETIEHGKTGLLCDVYDPNDIASKMLWMIENPEKGKKLGANARKEAKMKYDKNSILELNLNFYNQLISRG